LASIDDLVRLKLMNDPIYSKKFAMFMLTQKVKILYYLFHESRFHENFITNLFKCFSLIYTNKDLERDKDLFDLVTRRHTNTVQHMLNILCHKYSIDVNTFKKLELIPADYDFSHYSEIPTSLLLEYFIFKSTIKDMLIEKPINVRFIAHNNPILDEAPDLFKTIESLEQTSQSHSDVILYAFISDSDGIRLIKFYRDMKADYRGTNKGHLTLKPYLSTNLKIARDYMHNYITSLTQKISEYPKYKDILMRDSKRLQDCIDDMDNKILSLKDSILKFNQILLDISLKPLYQKLNIKFTIAADVDTDDFFIKNILPTIQANLEVYYHMFDLDIFFPKNNQINFHEYKKKILFLIDNVFPEDLRSIMRTNFHKFIEYTNE